jgi:uncharacterized protein YejL (UPF0352 family)
MTCVILDATYVARCQGLSGKQLIISAFPGWLWHSRAPADLILVLMMNMADCLHNAPAGFTATTNKFARGLLSKI